MGRGALWATVHGIAKSQTWLSDWAHTDTAQKSGCVSMSLTYWCCSVHKWCPSLWDLLDYIAHQARLFSTTFQSLLKLMSIESMMLSAISFSAALFFLQSFPASVFSSESALLIRWPKYWSNRPSDEYSGLISFRIDWFHLLAVQGTLKSLLQHHSSKASIL